MTTATKTLNPADYDRTPPRDAADFLARLERVFIQDMAPACRSSAGRCLYAPTDTPDTVGCAIGCMVPLDLAAQLDTGLNTAILTQLVANEALAAHFANVPRRLLDRAQEMHDSQLYGKGYYSLTSPDVADRIESLNHLRGFAGL